MKTTRHLRSRAALAALLVLTAVLCGCSDEDGTPCGNLRFDGFVETDENGDILSGADLGQWCLPGDEIPPTEPSFGPAFPNPFCRSVALQFTLPEASDVKVGIYNKRCQLIKTLVDGRLPAGTHQVLWNQKNYSGGEVPDGFYAAVIEVGVDWDCAGVLYVGCEPPE